MWYVRAEPAHVFWQDTESIDFRVMAGTELKDLMLKELSGVDDPAHGAPGWLVLKNAAGVVDDSFEDLIKGLDATEDFLANAPDEVKAAHVLLKQYTEAAVDGEGEGEAVRTRLADRLRTILTKGKDEVDVDKQELVTLLAEREERLLKAVEEKLADASEEFEEIAKSVAGAGTEESEEQTAQVASEDVDALKEALSKTLDRLENIEKSLAGSRQIEGQEAGEREEPKDEGGSALRKAFIQAISQDGPVVLGEGR